MILESKYIQDVETGTEFAPITTPNAVRFFNGDTLDDALDKKQDTLVSGTNIRTINGESVLGSGNISISGGSGDVNVIESITFNGDAVAVDSNKNAAITYTAPVTSVNGNTGDVTISTGDTNIIEGIKLDGESSSLTPSSKVVTIPSMGASGSNHRGGLVPDPGSTSGTTKYLREDGSWQTPPDTNTTYSASDFDIKDLADSTSLMSTWSEKQDALSSQTAYTSQGSATKVPQITTNSLGQVTGITEVTITQPDVSNFISTSSTTGLVKNDGSIDTNTYLTSSDLSGYVQTSNTTGLLKNDGTVDTTSYGTYSKPSGGIPAADLASGVIPTVPTISTDISSDATSDTKTTSPKAVKTFVEGKGYLTSETYTGTVTGVTMNSGSTISPDANGVVDLGTVITDISGKQDTLVFNTAYNESSNKVATMSDIPTVPTNVSSFNNDAGYTTNTGTVTSTGGTVTVNNIQVVSALPASPDANTLYLIPES